MLTSSKIIVNVVLLGTFAHDIERFVTRICNNHSSSELFMVAEPKVVTSLPEPKNSPQYFADELSMFLHEPYYPNEILLGVIDKKINSKSNFCYPLSENVALISTFGITELLNDKGIGIEKYLLFMLYKFSILKHGGLNFQKVSIHHTTVKNCLYAKCDEHIEIIQVLNNVVLCNGCTKAFDEVPIPSSLLRTIKKELKRFKKPMFYVLRDWIKLRPILSLIIIGLVTIFLNILSGFLLDILRGILR